MRIGYARVSTADQNMHLQEDALQRVTTLEKLRRFVGIGCPSTEALTYSQKAAGGSRRP